MPFRMKAEQQLQLEYDEHDAPAPPAKMSDEIFHSEFSGGQIAGGQIAPPGNGSLEHLQEALQHKVTEIDEQTGRLEKMREEKWQCDDERYELQRKVSRETKEVARLQAEITAMGETEDERKTKLQQELWQSDHRRKKAEPNLVEVIIKSGQANDAFESEMAKRRTKFQELNQLASQHQRLVRKIKTDPRQRRYKEHLEKTNESWDVIAWPRPPIPALIVANAIARQIDGEENGRRVYLIRNAERVQDVFPNWINECFVGKEGVYVIGDANMPREVPERRKHPDDYLHDPPVTEMGRHLAMLTGAALDIHDRDREFFFVSSPSLYCLQTAIAIKEGANMEDNKVAVEPGLFEDFHIEVDNGAAVAPNFLNAADFASLGGELNSVSNTYRQAMTLQAVKTLKAQNETPGKSSNRQLAAVVYTLKQAPANASVVIVAHPATLQAVDSFLGPRMPLPDASTAKDLLGLDYPYLSVVAFHELNGRWKRIVQPLPPFNRRPLTNATRVLNNDGQK